MALYFTSAVERATMDCFLVFHEIGEVPNNIQYPDVDFLVLGKLTQSLSQHAVSWAADEEAKRIPCAEFLSKYLKIRFAAYICTVVGFICQVMQWERKIRPCQRQVN